jgi:hypothetical protein
MTQEQWLLPVKPLTAEEIERRELTQLRSDDKPKEGQRGEVAGVQEVKSYYAGTVPRPTGPNVGGEDFKKDDEKFLFSGMSIQQYHEQLACPKRLVECPRKCLEWVQFEVLQNHMENMCTKREAKKLVCRLGCGALFGGLVEQLIEAEEDRHGHETDECIFRVVRCNWRFQDGTFCAAQMMAKDRDEHKEYHLELLGITTYLVPGTYLYRIPKKVTRIKVQVWGGGGGGGHFKSRQGAPGGGGAFIECILKVDPYDIFEVVVGSGGGFDLFYTVDPILNCLNNMTIHSF